MSGRSAAVVAASCAALLCAACSGEETSEGAFEPIRVWDTTRIELAQFVSGALPGTRKANVEPRVTSASAIGGRIALAGATDFSIRGWTTTDATSVAIALAKAGSGYWLLPTGAPDDGNNGELQWLAGIDLARDIPTGLQQFTAAAIDGTGKAGSQFNLEFCVHPPIPDNLNACDATAEPPFLVISLDWDRPVDLDLRVATPAGKIVDSKHPSTAPKDETTGKSDPTADGVGIIDHDSNRACSIDGQQRENLVFQKKPPSGRYLVYASLFDACGEPAVGYTVSTHTSSEGKEPGTFRVVERSSKSGVLRAIEAGGEKLGAYVTQVIIQ